MLEIPLGCREWLGTGFLLTACYSTGADGECLEGLVFRLSPGVSLRCCFACSVVIFLFCVLVPFICSEWSCFSWPISALPFLLCRTTVTCAILQGHTPQNQIPLTRNPPNVVDQSFKTFTVELELSWNHAHSSSCSLWTHIGVPRTINVDCLSPADKCHILWYVCYISFCYPRSS